jgi:hypothetical protein
VDLTDRYLGLARLGRDAFLAAAAPAALVRVRGRPAGAPASSDEPSRDSSLDLDVDTHVGEPEGGGRRARRLEIHPLVKKPSAPFPDMITIGRTPNNDVVLRDATVSRLHAFFRLRDGAWYVADGGSKNGTSLDGAPLAPRKECAIDAGQVLRLGDLPLTFYPAAELFQVLSLLR